MSFSNRMVASGFVHRRALAMLAGMLVLALSVGVGAAGKSKPGAGQATASGTAPGGEAAASDVVHISIQTVPPRKAWVKWGRKSLGVVPAPRPLVIERARDSGPMDLVIRATGFLPVHTRAYTFTDSRVLVKLTPPAEKSKLFGYKQEAAPNPDGGPPPPPEPPKDLQLP